jgi:glycerophosphoryl diester phosphodiesterase
MTRIKRLLRDRREMKAGPGIIWNEREGKMFLRVGHRGARAYETENTIASLLKAVELGANAVEFDVRQARDGTLVVIHDHNLKRVFAVDLQVDESSFPELRGASGGMIPTLAEALDTLAGRVEKILIELKEPGCEDRVLDLLGSMNLREPVILSSFHEDVLERLGALDQSVERGLIYARHKDPIASAVRHRSRYLIPVYRLVHTKDIHGAHAMGLKVIVWTINSRTEAEAFAEKGVDGIVSDRPDILKGLSTAVTRDA